VAARVVALDRPPVDPALDRCGENGDLGGIAGPGPAIVRQLGVAAGGGRRE